MLGNASKRCSSLVPYIGKHNITYYIARKKEKKEKEAIYRFNMLTVGILADQCIVWVLQSEKKS